MSQITKAGSTAMNVDVHMPSNPPPLVCLPFVHIQVNPRYAVILY